jgi:hypothetical protein
MTRRYRVALAMLGWAGAALLAGCAQPPLSGQAEADAQTRAACRQQADQAYQVQNRADIYSPPSSVNTPFSSNYLPGDTGRGLSALFAQDRQVSDCVRNTGTGTDRTVPAAATPAAPGPGKAGS